MKKLLLFPSLFLLLSLSSCGNDPEVEKQYFSAMDMVFTQLKKTNDVDGLVRAQDLLDSAKALPGVLELGKSSAVKEVEYRVGKALEEAQDRVMSALTAEASDTVILQD